MKSFKEYLTESQKTYNFKIRVAGDLPEHFEEHLDRNLQKFGLVKMSKGKTAPISEKPMDFPQLQNLEVHNFEAEIKYPTVPQHLEQYLVDNCTIDHGHIIVRGEFDPVEAQQQETTSNEEYQAMLTQEDMGGESAQADVGSNRVMDLLKELETARKERDIDPIESAPSGESKDIGDTQNNKAVIGS